jgi:Tfp pilus assembly protein PilZ
VSTPKTGYQRIPLIVRGSLAWRGATTEALVCNLSVLGVYVTSDTIPSEGEPVTLRFLPPDGQGAIECEAEVTWHNPEAPERVDSLPPGCGLRFTSMPPGDHERVAALIEDYRNAEQPLIARPVPRTGFTRIPYVQPCRLQVEGASVRAVICNLSVLGAYVAVDPLPPFQSPVRLTFNLPGDVEPAIVDCAVAWVNPDEPMEVESLPTGCGLRFVALPAALRFRLERLVDEYLKIPRDVV